MIRFAHPNLPDGSQDTAMLEPLPRPEPPPPANDNQRRAENQVALMALDVAGIAGHLDAILDELWARGVSGLTAPQLRTRISPHLQSARQLCVTARMR